MSKSKSKDSEVTRITIVIPKRWKGKLKKLAQQQDHTVSSLIGEAIAKHVRPLTIPRDFYKRGRPAGS